ncbi:MAG: hypothetical protein GWO41_06590 [candidate division Zixibacteria bacterium]|nr:hypothetical protein [candidate division Zixibacteria bacterium]NIR62884.1 hypothetical protein [candidate division Zixibacteria bacterium]NIS15992.1 hypothetical protein [candidate division Zixibacteria bacterium]NIS44899.1 hypothetical protein [candidate division Zixibacteria bacterium]NIT52401.1 hypothetical protein [candidate division Zixibacteria bacterium]
MPIALVRKIIFVLPLLATAFFVPQFINAFSSGPPDGKTGAPGEGLCSDCHLNSSGGDGSLSLSGVPAEYNFDQTYTLTVTIEDPDQQRWGFEITASDPLNNAAGVFTITDAVNTQLSDNAAPLKDYVKHTSTGTMLGVQDGPVSWNLDWTAPSSDVGQITFYLAGNGANGNFLNSGDFIYSTSVSAPPPAQQCLGICGDANNDELVNVSDAVWIINFVFVGGQPPQPVFACGDANADASVNVSDAVWIINFVFVGGAPPGSCSPGSWEGQGGDCCEFTV